MFRSLGRGSPMKKVMLGLVVAMCFCGCRSVHPRPVVIFKVELPKSRYLGDAQPVVEGRIEFDPVLEECKKR